MRATLKDLVEFGDAAARLVARGTDAYDGDEVPRLAYKAILHHFGEAVARLSRQSPEFIDDHPDVVSGDEGYLVLSSLLGICPPPSPASDHVSRLGYPFGIDRKRQSGTCVGVIGTGVIGTGPAPEARHVRSGRWRAGRRILSASNEAYPDWALRRRLVDDPAALGDLDLALRRRSARRRPCKVHEVPPAFCQGPLGNL